MFFLLHRDGGPHIPGAMQKTVFDLPSIKTVVGESVTASPRWAADRVIAS